MLQGQARGKVGDLVFYVRQGIQQTRVRNRQPANPRTISTMLQRVKLASVVGFYKRQASFFKFALKKSAKESYYNAFVRYNLNIAPYLTKEEAAAGVQIAAPYIIADGDMPQVGVNNVQVSIGNELSFKLSVSSSLTTWGAFRRAYGLLMGDMITFAIFNRGTSTTDPAQRIVAQHVFDQESENSPFGYDVVGLTFTQAGETWVVDVDKGYFNVSSWYAAAVAAITSRNAGGVDCSFAQLSLSENAEAEYLVYHSEEQHQEAATSYGSIGTAILDPKSFEGNYVDTIVLYGNTAHSIVLKEATAAAGEDIVAYIDTAKYPDLTDPVVESSTPFNPVADCILDMNTGKVTLTIDDEIPESGEKSADVVLRFEDAAGALVARSYIKITVRA